MMEKKQLFEKKKIKKKTRESTAIVTTKERRSYQKLISF